LPHQAEPAGADDHGLRPAPIYLGVVYAILGTVLSVLVVVGSVAKVGTFFKAPNALPCIK
jgi:hypothetical protein